MSTPSSKKSKEREFVIDSGASMHILSKEFKLRRSGDSSKIQESHNDDNSQWWSANERESASTCSRSSSLCDCAIARWHACRPFIGHALRRARMQFWADQWSEVKSDQTSQKMERNLRKFLESSEKSNNINTDNSFEFDKSCEDLSWNHRTSTPHQFETNGIAERAVRKIKGGSLRYCAIRLGWEFGKTISKKISQDSINFDMEIWSGIFMGEFGKEIFWWQTMRSSKIWTPQKFMLEDST